MLNTKLFFKNEPTSSVTLYKEVLDKWQTPKRYIYRKLLLYSLLTSFLRYFKVNNKRLFFDLQLTQLYTEGSFQTLGVKCMEISDTFVITTKDSQSTHPPAPSPTQ